MGVSFVVTTLISPHAMPPRYGLTVTVTESPGAEFAVLFWLVASG
jgi:hypothetical protein